MQVEKETELAEVLLECSDLSFSFLAFFEKVSFSLTIATCDGLSVSVAFILVLILVAKR